MNKFFHFGDSYALTSKNSKHFCNIISDSLNYEYINLGQVGLSNEQILNLIIENIFNFSYDDICFINFSFLERGCFYDETNKQLKSTNIFFNDIEKKLTNKIQKADKETIDIIEHHIKFNERINKKLFFNLNVLLKNLIKKGVKVFFIFIDDSQYINELLNFGINIKFENGFYKWLKKNNFHSGDDIHYSKNIQPIIAKLIVEKTNNFEFLNSKIIYINDTISKLDKNEKNII